MCRPGWHADMSMSSLVWHYMYTYKLVAATARYCTFHNRAQSHLLFSRKSDWRSHGTRGRVQLTKADVSQRLITAVGCDGRWWPDAASTAAAELVAWGLARSRIRCISQRRSTYLALAPGGRRGERSPCSSGL